MKKLHHADKYIFGICLSISIALFVGGFFCPPMGVIDGSVLTAGGILMGFAALGIAGQNLANGRGITFQHGETEVTIGDDDDGDNQ